jgi:hypothetical protein
VITVRLACGLVKTVQTLNVVLLMHGDFYYQAAGELTARTPLFRLHGF